MRPGPLGADAHGADGRPRDGSEAERRGRRRHAQPDGLDEQRLGDVEREVRRGLAEHRADQEREAAAHDEVEGDGAQRGAATGEAARGHERDARRQRDEHRLVEQAELRHAEVELALEDRQADEQAAAGADEPQVPDARRGGEGEHTRPARPAGGGVGGTALGQESEDPDQRQTCAPEHHEVRRAPQRDVLAEQPVGDVVEREAEQRERRAGHEHDPAHGHVPVAHDPDGGRSGALPWQHDREPAGGEDPEEPEQDEVVRRVGQRPGVAPVVDVQADVPVHAEDGREQRRRRDPGGQRGPAGQAAQARRQRRPAPEDRDAAGPVAEAERDERCGEDARRERRADDLAELRAACGRRGGGQRGEQLGGHRRRTISPVDVA